MKRLFEEVAAGVTREIFSLAGASAADERYEGRPAETKAGKGVSTILPNTSPAAIFR
jgi:hypothetical protein